MKHQYTEPNKHICKGKNVAISHSFNGNCLDCTLYTIEALVSFYKLQIGDKLNRDQFIGVMHFLAENVYDSTEGTNRGRSCS